jgi:hypothetical protein
VGRKLTTTMLLAPALALTALGVAACGSDDDSSETESGALSQSEFESQANDLCSKAATNREAVGFDPNAPGPQQAEQLAEIIDIDEKLLADVDQLVPPESEQDTVTQLLDQWRRRIDAEEQLRTATAGGDTAQASELESEIQQADRAADQIAGGLGLDECTLTGTSP